MKLFRLQQIALNIMSCTAAQRYNSVQDRNSREYCAKYARTVFLAVAQILAISDFVYIADVGLAGIGEKHNGNTEKAIRPTGRGCWY